MLEVGSVFELLFSRKVEQVLADSELAVDLILGKTEVGDVADVQSVIF